MYRGQDRRIFARVKGELIVRYSKEGGSKEFCATTINISGSGARIALLRKLSPGTVLDIQIFRKCSNASVKCRGEIAWVSSSEAGVKFIDPDLMYVGRLIKDLDREDLTIPSLN